MKIETAEDLERIVDEQNRLIAAMGELLKGMDTRIQLQQRLIDAHHEIFIQHGWAKARPIEKTPLEN